MTDPLSFWFNSEKQALVSSSVNSVDIGKHCAALQEALGEMTELAKSAAERLQGQNRNDDTVAMFPFEIGDYVLWSRVDQQGARSKLYATWVGPMQIVNTKSEYVYFLKHLVTGKTVEAHVSRMDFYSDDKLNVTEDLANLISRQGTLLDVKELVDLRLVNTTWQIKVLWDGFCAEEFTWEPFVDLFPQVPVLVFQFLDTHVTTDVRSVAAVWRRYKDLIQKEAKRRKIVLDDMAWRKALF